MHIVDHAFILLLFLVQPIYGAIESRRILARAKAGEPVDRIQFYRQTIQVEWVFLGVLMLFWSELERPFAALGFVPTNNYALLIGIPLIGIMVAALIHGFHKVKRADAEKRAEHIAELGDLAMYLPHNDRERNYFTAVSLTAGIVEEIVYRGFVIWYFGLVMPIWWAVVVSSVLFGLGHSYQGVKGAVRCGLAGLGFGAFYVITGSIWLPIVAHILLDALQGYSLRELLGKNETLQTQS